MLTLSLLFALHALYALTAGAGAVALEFRALKGARGTSFLTTFSTVPFLVAAVTWLGAWEARRVMERSSRQPCFPSQQGQ